MQKKWQLGFFIGHTSADAHSVVPVGVVMHRYCVKESLIMLCASHLFFAATKAKTVMGFSEGEGAAIAVVGQTPSVASHLKLQFKTAMCQVECCSLSPMVSCLVLNMAAAQQLGKCWAHNASKHKTRPHSPWWLGQSRPRGWKAPWNKEKMRGEKERVAHV